MKGFIIRWDDKKGYGFIKCEDGDEAFFHKKEFEEKGILAVEFDIIKTTKGYKAVKIKKGKCKKVKEELQNGFGKNKI